MTEYRLWCENGDLLGVYDTEEDAQEALEFEESICECDDGLCGVLTPHGYSIQVVDD